MTEEGLLPVLTSSVRVPPTLGLALIFLFIATVFCVSLTWETSPAVDLKDEEKVLGVGEDRVQRGDPGRWVQAQPFCYQL